LPISKNFSSQTSLPYDPKLGRLNTNIYDKWDDFNFKIINFPNMCSNIPDSPANGFRGDGLRKIGQSETRVACDRRVC
jgi:hypothetical protein